MGKTKRKDDELLKRTTTRHECYDSPDVVVTRTTNEYPTRLVYLHLKSVRVVSCRDATTHLEHCKVVEKAITWIPEGKKLII